MKYAASQGFLTIKQQIKQVVRDAKAEDKRQTTCSWCSNRVYVGRLCYPHYLALTHKNIRAMDLIANKELK